MFTDFSTFLASLASFATCFTVLAIYDLKRAELDKDFREERKKELEKLNTYLTTLNRESLKSYLERRKNYEKQSLDNILSEIHEIKNRCDSCFKAIDAARIKEVIIDPLEKMIIEEFSGTSKDRDTLEMFKVIDDIRRKYCSLEEIYPYPGKLLKSMFPLIKNKISFLKKKK